VGKNVTPLRPPSGRYIRHTGRVAKTDNTPSVEDLPKMGPLQYGLIAGGLAIAILMIVLASVYSADTSDTGPVFSGGPVDGGGDRDDAEDGEVELDINPIQAFLPRTGEGSTCTEAVGVDLIPGFSAILTINGVEIPPEDINGADGVATAGSSLGEVSWGPEEGCPRGKILRPQGNRLEACVYRNIDGADACRTFVHTFDAL
jgi:hypothetical protein